MKKFSIYNLQFTNNSQRGQVMLIAVVFLLVISLTVIFGLIRPIVTQIRVESNLFTSRESYFLAEAGVEDVVYRLSTNKTVDSSETLSLGGGSVTTSVMATPSGKEIVAEGQMNNYQRKIKTNLSLGDGISFHYGIQAGNGGFNLANSSSVIGNVYSSGPVTGAGNYIYGDVVSSGPTGLISGIHATGTAYAHTIQNSTIDKDAYYTSISGTTVSGANCTNNIHCHPGSADLPTVALPISDAQISQWESDANSGGSVTCDDGTYTIDSSVSIGPKKIPCDLIIKGNDIVVTLTGPVWVTGNVTTKLRPTIKIDPNLGSLNVAFIADNPSDRINSSQFSLTTNSQFEGSGAPGSFVFIISQNNSAENGGSNPAISVNQGTGALVAYASHGLITLAQSIKLKEVTAYKISLANTANVTYDTGLPNTLFESGPSGGYDILDWYETQ